MGHISTFLTLDGETAFRKSLQQINTQLKTLEKDLGSVSTMFVDESNKMQKNAAMSSNLSNQLDLLTRKQYLLTSAVATAGQKMAESQEKASRASAKYYDTLQKNPAQIAKLEERLKTLTETYGKDSFAAENCRVELERLKQEQTLAEKELAKAVKELDKNTAAYHKYMQQLSETETQIHKVEAEQRKLNDTETNTDKVVKKTGDDVSQLSSKLNLASSAFQKLANASVQVGTAIAKIELTALKTSLQAVTTELSLGVTGLEKYTEGFVKATTATAKFAASNGMTFEASMSKVRAYSGVSEEDMTKLADEAKRLGATTSKTAAESADALGYLALNGYKTSEMLASLEPIVKAAEAGNMSLSSVADMTANSLTAYGKSAEDTENFLNILTATQNNTSTSMEQLLYTYKDLSGTFKMLDVGFEESATLLGLVANRGLKGAEAGTALNSVMLRLLGTNKKSAEALTAIGVSAWDDAGNFKGLTKTLREVSAALEGMTTEKKTQFEKDISGVMRFQEFQKLLDAANDPKYAELMDTISGASANNYLYNTAATMLDNMKGKVTIMKSATEALGNTIFETFSEEATARIEKITTFINKLEEGVRGGFPGMMKAISEIGGGLSDMLAQSINMAARQFPQTLQVYNAAIIQGIKLLIKGLERSKGQLLPELITGAKNLVLDLVDMLPEFTTEITDAAVILFTGLVDAMDEIADKLLEVMPEVIQTITTALGDHGPEIFTGGMDILLKLIDGIVVNLPLILGAAQKILDKLGEYINKNTDKLFDSAFKIIESLADFVVKNLDGDKVIKFLELGGKILDKLVNILIDEEVLSKLFEVAVDILDWLCDYLLDNSDEIFGEEMPKMIDKLVSQILTTENDQKMDAVGQKLGEAVMRGLMEAIKGIFKIGINIGERGVLFSLGIEGGVADAVLGLVNNMNSEKKDYGGLTEERYNQLAEADREAYLYSMGAEFDESGTVVTMPDGSYGPFNKLGSTVNVYNPIINNAGDMERIAEQTKQLQNIAAASGGRY